MKSPDCLKDVKCTLSSTRGSSRLNSIFPWYSTENEAIGAERTGFLKAR